MIKIVEKNPFGLVEEGGGFVIEGSEFEVRTSEYAHERSLIVVEDKQGEVFAAWANPYFYMYSLVLSCITFRKDFFSDSSGQTHFFENIPDGYPARPKCVDARVLMAFILHMWTYTKEDDKEFNAAINPLPTLEEAAEWLRANRFCGENRYEKIGVFWYQKLDNVPPAIQALHDKRHGKSEKYLWEIHAEEEEREKLEEEKEE